MVVQKILAVLLLLIAIVPARAQSPEAPGLEVPEWEIPEPKGAEAEGAEPESDTPVKQKPFSRIGAGLGGSITGYRDEVESPINRYLNTVTYFLGGNVEKGIFFYSFNINFLMGAPRMAAPYTGYNHTEYLAAKGDIENAFDFRLWGNKTFPGYLGGSLRAAVYLAGVDFTDNGSENPSPPTGGLVLSLDLHASQKWIINEKHTLIFSLGYPLVGYAIRPAYVFFDEYWMEYLYEDRVKLITLGEFVSFHNYWAVFGDLKYHYTFNSLISPYAGLGFEVSRINFPRPRIDAVFRLNAGISFTF